MARKATVTVEALARLGAADLAQLLIDLAEKDAVLRRKLRLLLVGLDRPERLSAEISSRIQKIGRSRSDIDRDRYKAVAAELDDLRRQIVGRLGETQPGEAVERLWDLLGIARAVLRRCVYYEEPIAEVFVRAVADLGRITATLPGRDPAALAERIATALDADLSDILESLIENMSEALGPAGRAALRQRTEAGLAALSQPAEAEPDEQPDYDLLDPDDEAVDWDDQPRGWGVTSRRLGYVARLTTLADLDQDPDAFIVAVRAGGTERVHAADVAERLLTAGRPGEALAYLDQAAGGQGGENHVDLRIAAHDALGRPDLAQGLRWRCFEARLSELHLRDFLRHLPDFEDFEAEQRALDYAAAHREANVGLAFIARWPDLARADRLVRERLGELDATRASLLRGAARMLAERFPLAATLLYRMMVESVLERGASESYTDAVVDLLAAAGSAARIVAGDGLEPHARFIDRLQLRHGRKYKFWGLFHQTL